MGKILLVWLDVPIKSEHDKRRTGDASYSDWPAILVGMTGGEIVHIAAIERLQSTKPK